MSDDLVRDKLRLYADDVAPAQLPSFGGVTDRRRRRRTQRLLSATSALAVVALVVALAAVLGGGSTRAPVSGLSSELIGGTWSLGSITTAGGVWKAPADNGFSLSFTSSGYTGNDSCNGTSGAVSYGAGTVHLGSGAMTELGCPGDDKARMQDAFRLLIDKDLQAAVSGGTLTITAGRTVFALTRVQPAAPVDLSKALPGTRWALVSIDTTGTDVSSSSVVQADVQADIAFRTKDFSAGDGCNTRGGSVSYTTTTVTITDAGTTTLPCKPSAVPVEVAYGKILTGTVTPTLVGDTLTITNATQSLVFTRETPQLLADRLATALTSHEWNLITVTHGSSTESVPASQKAGLFFLPDRYSGTDGCNTQSGVASYSVTTVSLSSPEETKTNEAYCGGLKVTDVPLALHTVLAGVLTPVLKGDQLVLSARGYKLTFAAGAATASAPATSPPPATGPASPLSDAASRLEGQLVNHTWVLQSLKAPGVSWTTLAGSTANLTFKAKSFEASDGCSSYGSAVVFDASGSSLTFGGATSSVGECSLDTPGPPAGTFPPSAFLTFFSAHVQVQAALVGEALTLTRDGVVLTFRGEAPNTPPTYPSVTSDPAGKALQKVLMASKWRLEVAGAAPAAFLVFGTLGFTATDGTDTYSGAVGYLGGRLVMQEQGATSAGDAQESATSSSYRGVFAGPVDVDSTMPGSLTLTAKGISLYFLASRTPPTPPTVSFPMPSGGATVDANTVNLEQLVAGPTWMLSSITVNGTSSPKASSYGANLVFSGAQVHVDDGCNEGDRMVSYSGQAITFGLGRMSLALCPAQEAVDVLQDTAFLGGGSYVAVVLGPKLLLTSGSTVFTYLAAGSAGAPLSKATGP